MNFSTGISEKIQKRIDEFVAASEPFIISGNKTHDLREIAGKSNALPLLFDWGYNWGLRPDGEIVCFP